MIPHSRPAIDETDINGVLSVLQSGCLVQGTEVALFEKEMAAFIGVKSAVAVSSGTAALHLALLALHIGPGDEVIIPSFVCTALLNAVRLVGATPVLSDIDEGHFNMAVTDVKRRLTTKTKALIVPHLFGQAADIRELTALGLPIIEDCAQSLGGRYLTKMTGSYGILSIYSFYATKLLATGEGGMVMSPDEKLTEYMRDLRDYDEKDDDRLRYNYKMTDMQAALGRSQRKRLPDFLNRRQAIARRYDQALQALGFPLPSKQPDRDHIFYRYILQHGQVEQLMRAMTDRGIACRRPIYRPLHHYLGRVDFPVTERAWQESLSIPIYPALRNEDIFHIENTLQTILGKGI